MMYIRPVTRILARELEADEIDQVAAADVPVMVVDEGAGTTCWGSEGTLSGGTSQSDFKSEDDRNRVSDD